MKPPYIEIVEEVASREDVSPLDLPPIYDSISPGIRDALTSPNRDIGPTMFTYCGYGVVVNGKGHITIVDQATVDE